MSSALSCSSSPCRASFPARISSRTLSTSSWLEMTAAMNVRIPSPIPMVTSRQMARKPKRKEANWAADIV